MSDYKESTVAGNAWTRAYAINIDNPRNRTPTISFAEERVVVLEGEEIRKSTGYVTVPFDPDGSVPLYDPETLQPTGATVPQMQIYGILFSVYMMAALARDAAAQNPPAPFPPAP